MSAGPSPPDPAVIAAAQAAFHQFTVEAWTLLGVGIAVTVLRTYARVRSTGWRRLGGDDYLAWVAVLLYIAETSLAYSVGNAANGLANNGMTDQQRAALSPDNPEYHLRVLGSKIQLAGWSVYSSLLWTLKASLLVFYLRLTEGLSYHYRLRIFIGFAFLAASYIVVALNLYLSCRPFHKFWQIYPNPGNVCQPAISNQIVWVYLAFNVTTDIYLMSIPIPMLWAANLKPAKKVGLMILFGGGTFVIVCALLRCILIVTDEENGAQLAGSWAVRETFVAVVTSNLPMIFPLLKGWLVPLLGSLLTSRRSTNKLDEATPKDIRTFGGSTKSWRGRGPPTVHPITNFTMNGSEENIVEDDITMHDLKIWSDASSVNHSQCKTIRKDVQIEVEHETRHSLSKDKVTVSTSEPVPPLPILP
ncbi:hypothetical protein PT974_06522 [Cladobotryum mycophilum]|uniref:Rhodopsin domain-containing protein n=1 Tax=Cladobotryum mycophilum TaxID=491253 RepID=A0ABR0SM23_9HYPO